MVEKLIVGLHRFRRDVFRQQQELFERLAAGQRPETLFITCSDSRIDPNLITHTTPGELFVLRNAGNLVPPFGASSGGELATIEFAICGLGIRDIVVCGHSHCGAMKGLLHPEILQEMPAVADWLKHAETTRRIVRTKYAHLTGDELLEATIDEHVLVQLENLQTHPAVAAALAAGQLKLHAWVYDIPTGDVYGYDDELQQYVSLAELRPQPPRLRYVCLTPARATLVFTPKSPTSSVSPFRVGDVGHRCWSVQLRAYRGPAGGQLWRLSDGQPGGWYTGLAVRPGAKSDFCGGAAMQPIVRREFMGTAAAAGAAAYLGTTAAVAWAQQDSPPPPPQVPLGHTGLTLSRIGQGTGVHGGNRQSDQTRMGFEKLVGLFRHSYDRGLTFFDLADLYGTHIYFREALRKMDREKLTILTKLWWRYDGAEDDTRASHRKDMARAALERFRHEISTDYLDIVLLHCMTKKSWNDELTPYMEALSEAKEKKLVRAVGVSCHDYGALEAAAATPWVDVVLARINPGGVMMDGTPEQITQVLRRIKEAGKAVIGMKIFGEGKLSSEREKCVEFAQNLGLLDCMTIGFQETAQVDDMLRLIAKYPAKPLIA